MKEITLEAVTDNLHALFDFIVSELTDLGCSKKDIRLVKLCVEEIFINISSYAYNPDTGKAKIELDIDESSMTPVKVSISFFDKGKPFNPLEGPEPDIESDLYDRNAGGLGIYLVRTKMDDVTYEYRDGQNVLTISKDIDRVLA